MSKKTRKPKQTKLALHTPKATPAPRPPSAGASVAARTAADTGTRLNIPHGDIIPGYNARPDPKKNDREHIEQLKESIAAQGLLNPLIVFKHPTLEGKYASHAGECRHIAIGELMREKPPRWTGPVPCTGRPEKTESQRRIIGLLDNLARKNLDPIAEAEGLKDAIATGGFDAWNEKEPARSLAHMLGITKSTVFAKLNLANLCPLAKQAARLGSGHKDGISASVADKLARIRDPKLQAAATAEAIRDRWTDAQAGRIIAETYQHQLKGAQFDVCDPELAPLNKATGIGGPCAGCNARSGNQKEMFGEFDGKTGRGDMCLNMACYRRKTLAAYERAALQKGVEAKPLAWLDGKSLNAANAGYGYVRLDDRCTYEAGGKNTYRELLKAALEAGELKITLLPYRAGHGGQAEPFAGWHETVNETAAGNWFRKQADQKKKKPGGQKDAGKPLKPGFIGASHAPAGPREYFAGDFDVKSARGKLLHAAVRSEFRKAIAAAPPDPLPMFRAVVDMLGNENGWEPEALEILGLTPDTDEEAIAAALKTAGIEDMLMLVVILAGYGDMDGYAYECARFDAEAAYKRAEENTITAVKLAHQMTADAKAKWQAEKEAKPEGKQ